jgi:excisionase family DNA binding protein
MTERFLRFEIGRDGMTGTLYLAGDLDLGTAREIERAVAAALDKRGKKSPPRHQRTGSEDDLLTSADVAQLFGVDRTTIVMWAKHKRIPALRTPGGQLRFRAHKVLSLLGGTEDDDKHG